MADNRLPNMAGQGVPHSSGYVNMPNIGMGMGPVGQPMFAGARQPYGGQAPFSQPQGMPFYPGMGAPAMGMPAMAPGMYPMQSMRPPGGPPPPYGAQHAAGFPAKTRTGVVPSRAGVPKPKTEKELYFEQQQKRLKQFGRPGAQIADADKLIENMFGKTEKPHHPGNSSIPGSKPSAKPEQNITTQDDDDGFGDFLGGPSATPAPAAVTSATPTSVSDNVQARSTHSPGLSAAVNSAVHSEQQPSAGKPAVEKKDLMAMMMECSDLNAPQKAKGFHKPSLLEVQKLGAGHAHRSVAYHESDHARKWDNTQELEGLFIVEAKKAAAPPSHPHLANAAVSHSTHPPTHPLHGDVAPRSPTLAVASHPLGAHPQGGHVDMGGQLPAWCQDKGNNLPVVYRQVFEACSDGDRILTERLYPILLLSGLPRERLGQLWNLANTQTPGQLTLSELWILLALIALVQNNYEVTSLAILRRCPQAPVPFFNQPGQPAQPPPTASPPPSSGPAPVHAPTPSAMPPHVPSSMPQHAPASMPHAPASMPQHVPSSMPPHASTSISSHPYPPSSIPTAHPPPIPTSHPAVIPGVAMVTANIPTSAPSVAQTAEDDFADFQAAPAASAVQPKATAVRTEDSYGEFIGGAGSASRNESITSVPQAAVEKLETMYTESISIEDQYNSNVRNFFCSSDSSTASEQPARKPSRHTTPNSLDDDDFTDGHDSMSQVSTSEQSESEDIRAFENYVEEFNRKRDAQASRGSPLRGALSTAPKHVDGTGMRSHSKNASGSTSSKMSAPTVRVPLPKVGAPGSTGIPAIPPLTMPGTTLPGANAGNDDFDDFKSAAGPADKIQKNAGFGGGGGDDFAEFKAATHPVGSNSKTGEMRATSDGTSVAGGIAMPPANAGGITMPPATKTKDDALIGDEDKYGALRSLTDTQPSLFEQKENENNSSAFSEGDKEDDDDWAEFSGPTVSTTAPASVAELSLSASHVPSANTGFSVTADDEGDWANFETAKEVPPNSSSVVDTSFSSFTIGTASSKILSSVENSWSGASDAVKNLDKNSSALTSRDTGFGNMAPSGQKLEEEEEEDWADFAAAEPKHSSKPQALDTDFAAFPGSSHTSGDLTSDPVFTGGDGSVFTSVTASDWSGSANSLPSGSEFTGEDQSKFVTVKKKNLGTSDIMGVFKVRDDPAALSSYELPKKVFEHPKPTDRSHPYSSERRQRNRSGSKEHRHPSDHDDEFGPPPLDSVGDDDDDHEYSRGYDLDDIVHQPVPTTVYSPFGFSHTSSGYSSAGFGASTKTSRAHQPNTADARSHSLSPDPRDPDSLSNRVTSLREDSQSVSSLELPSSRMPADLQRDSDTGGTDSQSVSSMEFGVVEGSGKVEGVAESKSLDSLDLQSEHLETEEAEDEDRSNRQGSQPPPGPFGQGPILGDRYNIDGQVEGSDRYAYEWERCLASCSRLISGANNIFNTISSSTICNEVLRSPQGSDYVLGVIEIYKVVCRIMAALPTTAISSSSIEESLKNIDLAWNNLTAFLVGASLLPEQSSLTFTHAVLKSDSPAAQQKACGVCLLDVDSRPWTSGNGNSEEIPKLSYGGRQYHAPCANFWVNCVDSMLPALKLPELL